MSLLKSDFNSVTLENALKWGVLHSTPDSYDFTEADSMMADAKGAGMRVRGHTLLWPGTEPSWVNDTVTTCTEARSVLKSHIETVVTRYAQTIEQWDVANEIYDKDGRLKTNSPFTRLCGENLIIDAFRWAAAAAPKARLYLNDDRLTSVNAAVQAYSALIDKLHSARVPIHGIGLQTHLKVEDGAPDSLPSVMALFREKSIDVEITELDVRLSESDDEREDLKRQAAIYESVAKSCVEASNCTGITVWGFTDKYSWLSASSVEGGPTIRDANFVPKLAYDALREGLCSNSCTTSQSTTSSGSHA